MTSNDKKLEGILTEAHNSFEKGLNRHAFFKVNDHILGEDLVQDTFIKTWMYLVRVGKIETMKAFLYHVLNGLIIDEYRKHKTVSLDVLIEKGIEPSISTKENLYNILDGKSAMLTINLLPTKYIRIMKMKYVQDLNLSEMSLLTGISKSTLAVQLFRGLNMLKKIYHKKA
jgi:RNA polymerase sigma-70 factor (ECF subfamily)